MTRICLIVCHFGPFPRWWPLYLGTCDRNRDVDLLVFADHASPVPLPGNARLVNMTLAELESRITRRVGFKAALGSPYKICDFRPAFGVVFEEYLEGYDFWGHSDTDVLLGDIKKVLTTATLDTHDVIATRAEYLTGHFTLFRNTPSINRLYERSPDVRRVFSSPQHFCFDECNFRWRELLGTTRSIFETTAEIQSMTHVVRKAEREDGLRVHMRTIVREVQTSREGLWMRWDDGTLMDVADRREYLCLHFHSIRRGRFYIPRWVTLPKRFYVSRSGVFSLTGWQGVSSLSQLIVKQLRVRATSSWQPKTRATIA